MRAEPTAASTWSLRTAHTMAALVALYTIPTALFGELIPINDGLGNDGEVYAEVARRFGSLALDGGLDSYDVWRSLPCGIVWAGLKLVRSDFATIDIVRGFRWLAVAELIASVYVLRQIGLRVGLTVEASWLAFVGLFGSWFVLRWLLYDPVLIDASAFVIGLGLVWALVSDKRWALAVTTLLAGFVWQEAFIVGLVLLALPRHVRWGGATERTHRLALGVCVAGAVVSAALLVVINDDLLGTIEYAPPWQVALPVSIAIAAAWIGAGLLPVLTILLRARAVRIARSDVALTFGLLAIVVGAHALLARDVDPVLDDYRSTAHGVTTIMRIGFWNGIQKPGVFLLAHVAFFGPVVLLVVACWPKIVRRARDLGLGAVALLGLLVVLSVKSESRQFVELVPFAVVLAAVAVAPILRIHHVVTFGVLTLAASKAWLPINHETRSRGRSTTTRGSTSS